MHGRVIAIAALACAAVLHGADVQAQAQPPAVAPAGGQAPRTPIPGDVLRIIDAWLSAQQAYDRIPAMSAGIVSGDALAWSGGYGFVDSARRTPASASTIYSICSISKLFTAIALMQQVEAGKVRLDEPVTTYLPWAKVKPSDPQNADVTVRSLLTHSSGLPRETGHPYWSGPDFVFPTPAELRDSIDDKQMMPGPARRFQYSNLGLTLVGDIVEAVSGRVYADYVRERIIGPLNLADTRTTLPTNLYETQLPRGFGALQRDGTRERLNPFDTRAVTAAAGYSSTVNDLASFASWQFRILRSGAGGVLKPTTLREMQRVQFIDPDWQTSWGLGFNVNRRNDRTFVGHNGSCPGYQSQMTLEPASETAVIVMNNTSESAGPYVAGIFDLLAKRARMGASTPAAPADLEAYAGAYSGQPWSSEILVYPWGDQLAALSVPTRSPADFVLMKRRNGVDFFRVRDDGTAAEDIRFERDSSGRVVRFVRYDNPRERLSR
jgi:CubicO group peptidase (beta-lactamase class C family)